tara:strand:- start:4131 stop:4658 length:528 start_codon:yes stop_codon:yes gene_type:complete
MGNDRMDQGLEKAIGKFKDALKDLPSDGEERTVSITIGGDNHGNITFGHHITINSVPQENSQPRPLTEQEMRSKEGYAKQQRFNALVRSFVNIPNVLLVFFILMIVFALLSGHLWRLVSAIPSDWGMVVPLSVAVVMFPLAGWSFRIRKLEKVVIQEAQSTLDTIRLIRHRQRVS